MLDKDLRLTLYKSFFCYKTTNKPGKFHLNALFCVYLKMSSPTYPRDFIIVCAP